MFPEQFSIENIPYGIASSEAHPEKAVVTRLGDQVIFLDVLVHEGLLSKIDPETQKTFSSANLNPYIALSKSTHAAVRQQLQSILSNPQHDIASAQTHVDNCTMHLPFHTTDFTDFSCSLDHMLNAAEAIFGRREAPPAFQFFPPAYGGRSGSIVVSGTPITRPKGQYRDVNGEVVFGPEENLDYELEVACVIGKESVLGTPVKIEDADEHIFGLVLLNDWSARTIQAYEMNPLGPINSKSFGTTISPWVIPLAALEPFRVARPPRTSSIPLPSHFRDPHPLPTYAFDLTISLRRANSTRFAQTCKTNFQSMYWTLRDLLVHQTVNGCKVNTGDLLASGTVSGGQKGQNACLLETARGGGVEIEKEGGGKESLVWLGDGDTVLFTAVAGEGVGFGECVGTIVPAV